MKKLVAVLLMLCLVLSVGCASNTTSKVENMLRVPGGTNPVITDPQRTGSYFEVALNCFDRLVETKTVAPLKTGISSRTSGKNGMYPVTARCIHSI